MATLHVQQPHVDEGVADVDDQGRLFVDVASVERRIEKSMVWFAVLDDVAAEVAIDLGQLARHVERPTLGIDADEVVVRTDRGNAAVDAARQSSRLGARIARLHESRRFRLRRCDRNPERR